MLTTKYRPHSLGQVVGQPFAVEALRSFLQQPASTALVFSGPSGVGKTAAAWALAAELGCDPNWGGVQEIPSGTQDGRAVEELLKALRLRPLYGSGWRVAIINEADRMTEQAEAIWLDGLEKLPSQCVVIFTTNNPHKLTQRFRRRCELIEFDGRSETYRKALGSLVRKVWKAETGQALRKLPEGLGQFESCDDSYSIGLALQQIAPYARAKQPLPERFGVPIVRRETQAPASRVEIAPPSADAPVVVADRRTFCVICQTWAKRGAHVRPVTTGGDRQRFAHANCRCN